MRSWAAILGGVYLFEGGIAEAYGNQVKKVFTWSEIKVLQRHRTLTLLNLIPIFYEDEYLITALREDLREVDGVLLDRRLIRGPAGGTDDRGPDWANGHHMSRRTA